MTREEMEALVRTVTLEVMRALQQPSTPAANGHDGARCDCGCGGCRTTLPAAAAPDSPDRFRGRLLTEAGLETAARNGATVLRLASRTIVTPLARDRAAEMGIALKRDPGGARAPAEESGPSPIECPTNTIAFFSGRRSLTHEKIVTAAAARGGFEVYSCTHEGREGGAAPALACARLISQGQCCRGVVLGDEIYSVLRQANRLPGVQAQVCWDVQGARESRRSEANLMLLSDGQLGLKMLERMVEVWLAR
jgi:ribose 5-phosphate isomerase RpiB